MPFPRFASVCCGGLFVSTQQKAPESTGFSGEERQKAGREASLPLSDAAKNASLGRLAGGYAGGGGRRIAVGASVCAAQQAAGQGGGEKDAEDFLFHVFLLFM